MNMHAIFAPPVMVSLLGLLGAAASTTGCSKDGVTGESGDSATSSTSTGTTAASTAEPSTGTAPTDSGMSDSGMSASGSMSTASTSSSGAEPFCGDGFVDPGEECDDGPLNADDAACTALCEQAVCGDGHLWAGVEACDDGDPDPGDGCSASCQLTCGGGPCDPLCDLGTVIGDELGLVRMFKDGADIPAGTYRVTYVQGCIKYGGDQNWTVHAYEPNSDGTAALATWALVGADKNDIKAAALPGWHLYGVGGTGGWVSFADCVAANQATTAIEYSHAGGPLGVWLSDTPYPDNLPGEDQHNPEWHLLHIDTAVCPDRA